MYALAADCSIGSAGSAILMTHSRSAQGEPALIYLKVRKEERRGEERPSKIQDPSPLIREDFQSASVYFDIQPLIHHYLLCLILSRC